MREEQVTRYILSRLIGLGWEIVCFDFPQSGTGRLLHPDNSDPEKNKGAINPDIVAVKDGVCLFWENKDRFYLPDFQKQNALINGGGYARATAELIGPAVQRCGVQAGEGVRIFYGIGLPSCKYSARCAAAAELVDFIAGVDEDGTVRLLFKSPEL